jgi:hypothetical protein
MNLSGLRRRTGRHDHSVLLGGHESGLAWAG